MSLKELQLPSIASLRAVAALKSPHLSLVRPARIGLGFESAGVNQRSLLEVEEILGGPGRLSLPYSLRWLLDAVTGLSLLHRTLGFVHGEVQPEHVVLGEDGVGRLVPVVRAHWVRGEERAKERLYYLAPERLLGDRIDVRADVFSVGVMLWEALQGQRLLEAYEVDDIIARFMGGGIPRPSVPEDEAWTLPLAAIAERAISVDPGRRFSSVAEMRDSIDAACHRYLASAPGMAELFRNPERRVRSHARDSSAPDSQRATLPPTQDHDSTIEASTPHNQATLEEAAERLSRSSFASIDLEEELTTKPNAASKRSTEQLPVARPQRHVDTLLGVPPPPVEPQRDSYGPDSVTTPFVRPASIAPTLLVPVGASSEATPSQRAPEPPPANPRSPSWPPVQPALTAPVVATSARPVNPPAASLSPMVARAPQPRVEEPSFELQRPRKRRATAALWLALGAAAAIALFAARPWLSRQVAAATGAMPDHLAPHGEATAEPQRARAPTPEPSGATTPLAPRTIGIASTPPAPSERALGGRARSGPRDGHVVIHDSIDATFPQPAPPEPAPERASEPEPPSPPKSEPQLEPPPTPAAAPAPTSTPKPKPAPASDADRYGI